MTTQSHAQLRRTLVQSPTDVPGLYGVMQALQHSDPDAAVRMALRLCNAQPQDRRHWNNLLILLRRQSRWAELQDRLPRGRLPVPPRARLPVDLDAAINRYDQLLKQAQERAQEGWTPSRVEISKWRFPLTRERLAAFRRSEVASGTQTYPDVPSGFKALDFSRLYPDVSDVERREVPSYLQIQFAGLLARLYLGRRPGIDWYDALAADDDRFAARTFEVPGIGTATAKSVQSAYYACTIAALVPQGGVVLEIGGGFGALASRLLAIRPDITYLLTDLPVNMVLTHSYLTSLYGDAVGALWEDGDRPQPGQRAVVVPPWRLASLPLRVNLAVNTMSFQHMDERNHAFYGAALKGLGARGLYHLNRNVHIGEPPRDTMVVPAERYGFMADFEVLEQVPFNDKWIEVVARARG